jgi:FkbM family methyltransferase
MGKIKTYAFEPVSEFNEAEQESIYLNKLENYCQIYNYAVGDANEEIKIHLSGTGSSLNRGFLDNKVYKERIVRKIKLDDFIFKEEIPVPDFIKIDVEGYENFVFKGSTKIINICSPVIWFESARTLKARGYVNSDFFANIDFLESNGYSIFLTRGKELNRINRNYNRDGVEMFLAMKEIEHKGVFEHLLKNNFVIQ